MEGTEGVKRTGRWDYSKSHHTRNDSTIVPRKQATRSGLTKKTRSLTKKMWSACMGDE